MAKDKNHSYRIKHVPSKGSTCEKAADGKDSSAPLEQLVQTPRSGLSLCLICLSCLSLKTCESSTPILLSGVPFMPFRISCTCMGRGDCLSFSRLDVWICCSESALEDWLWRNSFFESILLIILPLPSCLWFCFKTVAPTISLAEEITLWCCDMLSKSDTCRIKTNKKKLILAEQ